MPKESGPSYTITRLFIFNKSNVFHWLFIASEKNDGVKDSVF